MQIKIELKLDKREAGNVYFFCSLLENEGFDKIEISKNGISFLRDGCLVDSRAFKNKVELIGYVCGFNDGFRKRDYLERKKKDSK